MTAAERDHVTAVKRKGCLCCMLRSYPHDPDGPMVEAHHLLAGGIRRGHMFVIGLCAWHHRSQLTVSGWDHKQHRHELGPSLAEGGRPFAMAFGPDERLLEMQGLVLADQWWPF